MEMSGECHTNRWLVVVLAYCVGLFGCASDTEGPAVGPIVISGATVIDGTGGEPIADGLIVLDGERIGYVGPAAGIEIPEGAQVVSAEGAWVIPGMIDVHMHFWESGRPGAQPTSWSPTSRSSFPMTRKWRG